MPKTGVKLVPVLAGLVILTLIGPLACRRGNKPSPELQSLLASDTLDRQVGDATVRAAGPSFLRRDRHHAGLEPERPDQASRPGSGRARLGSGAWARPECVPACRACCRAGRGSQKACRRAAATAGGVRPAADGRADSTGSRCRHRAHRAACRRQSLEDATPTAESGLDPGRRARRREPVAALDSAPASRVCRSDGWPGRVGGRRSQGWLARHAWRRGTRRLTSRCGRAAQAPCCLRRSGRGVGSRPPVRSVAGSSRARVSRASRPAGDRTARPEDPGGPERPDCHAHPAGCAQPRAMALGRPTTWARVISA